MNQPKTLEQLKAEVAAMEAAQAKTDREAQQAKTKAWNQFVRTQPWRFEVKPKMYQPWGVDVCGRSLYANQLTPQKHPTNWNGRQGYEVPACYVTRYFDEEFLDAWVNIYGPALETNESQTRHYAGVGMCYMRTDEGILNHESGGTHVLRTPMLCSDAEWAEIIAGRIPDKFIL